MNSSTPLADVQGITPSAAPEERPLVTIALFAYNQERFVREAIEGAFAQTYSPLEIILSDDCSDDQTFEIMQNMAQEYRGPHQLILNRNHENLGVGAHVNRVVELSAGELIVAAAGDDISAPHRVETLLAKWLQNGKPGSICSMASVIDQDGTEVAPRYTAYDGLYPAFNETEEASLTRYAVDGSRHLLGCSAAWNRATFDLFGPIADGVMNEDTVIGFRSWLLSRISYCPDPLVRYRTHGTNLCNSSAHHILTTYEDFHAAELRRCKRAEWRATFLRQHLVDIARARALNLRNQITLNEVEDNIRRHLVAEDVVAGWVSSGICRRIRMLARIYRRGLRHTFSEQLVRLSVPPYCATRVILRRLADTRRWLLRQRPAASRTPLTGHSET